MPTVHCLPYSCDLLLPIASHVILASIVLCVCSDSHSYTDTSLSAYESYACVSEKLKCLVYTYDAQCRSCSATYVFCHR